MKLPEKFAVVLGISTALALSVLACNDAVSLEREIKQGLTVDSDAGGDPNNVPDGSPMPPPVADGGSCAEYTKESGRGFRGDYGPAGCMVASGPELPSGPIPMVKADESSATFEGSRLHLMCKSEGVTVMDATIDCYQGKGSYVVPPGALMLAGKVSDRPCTLVADGPEGSVLGFISCNHDEDSYTNVFAATLPPWGLGAYEIPITQ